MLLIISRITQRVESSGLVSPRIGDQVTVPQSSPLIDSFISSTTPPSPEVARARFINIFNRNPFVIGRSGLIVNPELAKNLRYMSESSEGELQPSFDSASSIVANFNRRLQNIPDSARSTHPPSFLPETGSGSFESPINLTNAAVAQNRDGSVFLVSNTSPPNNPRLVFVQPTNPTIRTGMPAIILIPANGENGVISEPGQNPFQQVFYTDPTTRETSIGIRFRIRVSPGDNGIREVVVPSGANLMLVGTQTERVWFVPRD